MKKLAVILGVVTLALLGGAAEARAQGTAGRGPDPSTLRDSDLEKDSMHNLEVARQYFKLKKAYYASLTRCKEIIEANPVFAKIDEALYIAGMSDYYLSQNRGKQKVENIPEQNRQTAEKYREEARQYLSMLVNDYPDSKFRNEAQDALKDLGGPLPKKQ